MGSFWETSIYDFRPVATASAWPRYAPPASAPAAPPASSGRWIGGRCGGWPRSVSASMFWYFPSSWLPLCCPMVFCRAAPDGGRWPSGPFRRWGQNIAIYASVSSEIIYYFHKRRRLAGEAGWRGCSDIRATASRAPRSGTDFQVRCFDLFKSRDTLRARHLASSDQPFW